MRDYKKLTTEKYKKLVSEIHKSKISVLGNYKNKTTKVLLLCNICGNKWEAEPYLTLGGCGCRSCVNKSRTKTHSEFLKELKNIHGDKIDVLEEYVNGSTPIKFRCNIDGHEWKATPNSITGKNATGCVECYRRKTRRTHEEYVESVHNIHGDKISILGRYINSTTKIDLKCNICDFEWSASYRSTVGLKHGCPRCGKNKRKKTHEKYICQVHEVHKGNIEIIDCYMGHTTKIKTKCNKHNIIWDARPSDILRGMGCCKCSKESNRRTHEEYVELMKELHPNIKVLGKYLNSLTKVELECSVCKKIWKTTPNSSIGKKRGCPYCSNCLDRTHEDYVKEMKDIHPNIKVLGKYVNTQIHVELECNLCGHKWKSKPGNSINGKRGCPICKESKLEKETRRILETYGYTIKSQVGFKDLVGYFGVALKFDFSIIYKGELILIECQGIQHFKPTDFNGEGEDVARSRFTRQIEYDKMKKDYCKNNGYRLIEISYNENVLEALQKQGLCLEKETTN